MVPKEDLIGGDEGDAMDNRDINLTVNGEMKQQAKIGDMIWRCEEMVGKLAEYYTLEPGDIVMTGTPAGVGPVVRGETVKITVTGVPDCEFVIE